jgi:hypothetical protein
MLPLFFRTEFRPIEHNKETHNYGNDPERDRGHVLLRLEWKAQTKLITGQR